MDYQDHQNYYGALLRRIWEAHKGWTFPAHLLFQEEATRSCMKDVAELARLCGETISLMYADQLVRSGEWIV